MPLSPVIQIPIQLTSAELCRERIREIIEVELDYQYQNSYNVDAQVTEVVTERSNPVDVVEETYVNVSVDSEVYSQKDRRGSRTANVTLNIDVFAYSTTTSTERGDSAAKRKCTRLLSMISYILDDPQYKTLGFDPGFIHTTGVENFEMSDAEKYDTKNSAMGRLVFNITVTEANDLIDCPYIESAITSVMIGLTGKGFKYTLGDDYTPALNPKFVYVQNQNGDTIELVPILQTGTIYTITQITNIVQNLGTPVTTIVQHIPE